MKFEIIESPDFEKEKNIENQKPSEIPIENILGSGVTVLGYSDLANFNVFCEQMAVALAQGSEFLNAFDTKKTSVLIIKKSNADFIQTKQRIHKIMNGPSKLLHIEQHSRFNLWPHKGNDNLIQFNGNGVIFFGNFSDICTPISAYIKHDLKDLQPQKLDAGDPRYTPYFINERDNNNITLLRDFCCKHNVAIVLGWQQNSRGTYNYSHGTAPRYCDNRLYLKPGKGNEFVLEIGISYDVPSNKYSLYFDYIDQFKLTAKEVEQMQNQKLTPPEKFIIDLMWGKGGMRYTDIFKAVQPEISEQTFVQKLKTLQTDKKGNWLRKDGSLYKLDESKKRYWQE